MKDQRKAKKERASFKGAVGFEVNPYYEQLLEMREQKPAAYRVMSAATHLAVEAYIKAKAAASIGQKATRVAA